MLTIQSCNKWSVGVGMKKKQFSWAGNEVGKASQRVVAKLGLKGVGANRTADKMRKDRKE